MGEVKMVKKKNSIVPRLGKKRFYKGEVRVQNGSAQTFAKPIIVATGLSKSKRLKSFESKPAFSAELIETVLGAGAENKNGIVFKCPPKGRPAFKIKD